MGRSPSGLMAMDGQESQARSAAGEGEAPQAPATRAHPLPNLRAIRAHVTLFAERNTTSPATLRASAPR